MSDASNDKNLPRPPVVAVLGHVDHGKTTLLDHIRKSNVAAREAGGITQSIGAYEITHSPAGGGQARKITFIDTPGHEAFTKMRSRGASIADLAILVVAADEGVKPQTKESIRIIEESKTPFIVAITKMDKTGADVERVKSDLANAGVLLEGYGGQISYQPVSAKSGENVDDLLDLILLAVDLEHLTYDPAAPASGYVLEAKMDRRRGLEATVIVKNGTLRQGSPIATRSARGKVKIMEDFLGKAAKELAPSAPALIIGFETLPQVGEEFSTGELSAVPDGTASSARTSGDAADGEGPKDAVRVLVKASDAGSLEALSEIVKAMGNVQPVRLVAASAGDVTDNDAKFAISSGATVLAFRSKTDKAARALAEANGVRIISSEIIYDLVKSVEDLLKEREAAAGAGELDVLAVFNQTKLDKQVVGGKVARGTVKNRAAFTVIRNGAPAGQGRVTNLQQNKKDAAEVAVGNECGMMVSANVAIAAGDRLQMQ